MDLSRAAYSRDLKVTAMRALDAGSTGGEIARKYQLSPKLLERWRGEWRARGELAFPGIGRRGEEGFSSCSVHPCHRAVATAPPECSAAPVSCDVPCCLRPISGGSASEVKSFEVAYAFTFVTAQ